MADPSFWMRQCVLLTGHTGFKGAWLGLWLKELGAQVFGLSLAPATSPNLFSLLGSASFAGSTIADIRNRVDLAQAVDAVNPTVAIHMAAQPLVRQSYLTPIETFETNVIGTANLLDVLRDRPGLRAVLVITTDKVYRNLEDGRAFQEEDPLGAHDPYSASKAAAEIVVGSWAQSFFLESRIPILTARAGNVIGGGDWAEDRLVPDIWRAVQSNEPPRLRCPRATRPWQHVTDPLAGYLRYVEVAAQKADIPRTLNFGPDPVDRLTVAELTEAMLHAMGADDQWTEDIVTGAVEMQTLALNPALADKTIGWRPRLSSIEAIAWTAEWYGRFARGEDAKALCLEQLSRYEALP